VSTTPLRASSGADVLVAGVLLVGTTVIALLAAVLFADLLWRLDWWNATGLATLVVFVVLTWLTAYGFVQSAVGFVVRRGKRRAGPSTGAASSSQGGATTAIAFPIFDEDVTRTFEGLRATYESLARIDALDGFTFFVLSDTGEPIRYLEEERCLRRLAAELGAGARIRYRRRAVNAGKKCGNIRDFLCEFGGGYRYFVVLDADSVMAGRTLVELVRLMEENPGTALIQTLPALVNARTLFGRAQQFANRLCSPLFAAGLAAWSKGAANYYGHNAIVRTRAFVEHCGLPPLPGPSPFGGAILSHDFVEAALLVKAGWRVRFVDLPGSWEEGPQGLIQSAVRDRRWCQGNLQHLVLQLASGLRWPSRVHMLLGTFAYLGAPLWLVFLLLTDWMLFWRARSGLSELPVGSSMPFLDVSAPAQALLLFLLSMGLLFAPRVLALAELALDRARRAEFGGLARAGLGVVVESSLAALQAPVLMLWHTQFVAAMVAGVSVRWDAQDRSAAGTSWREAFRRHAGHTAAGVAWGTFHVVWLPSTIWWFVPLLAGLCLSIPLSVWTSRGGAGRLASRLGLLATPEELRPPPELARLATRLAEAERKRAGSGPRTAEERIAELILDPLLLQDGLDPDRIPEAVIAELDLSGPCEKFLTLGPDACSPEERRALLADPAVRGWLHCQAWQRSGNSMAKVWRTTLHRMVRDAAKRRVC
jgi:membrane glycosyltransferase